MERILDTSLQHATLFWPIAPPRASMLVVVKATYVLTKQGAFLSPMQDPVTGELYWDDDPEKSVRYPSDLALLKPRGECFVAGHCRPLTDPVERTVAAFQVGNIKKSFAVIGDRQWNGRTPTPPVPFTEMPLQWERSFGGPGHSVNPVGVGMADRLPNLEPENQPITSPSDKPASVGAFPLGMRWKARAQYLGTYDAKWQAERHPWLPEDFRFAFYNEAPLDQQIDGYWMGGERVALRHLHPSIPRVDVTLPRLVPRVFVEHDATSAKGEGHFEEIGLVCDTLVVDADRGVVNAVWRGSLQLPNEELTPTGLARLFVMHEALEKDGRASGLDACRQRMLDKIARDAAELAALEGEEPPPEDEAAATMIDGGEAAVAAAQAAYEAMQAANKEPHPDLVGDGLQNQIDDALKAAGIDVDAAAAEAEEVPEGVPPLDEERVREIFGDMGEEVPDEILALLRDEDDEEEDPPPPPPVDLREVVVGRHQRGLPVEGDFSGVNLAGLDLSGMDARNALFHETSFRGTNLTGAKLDGATMLKADFFGANLARASLRAADLTGAVLEAVPLHGSVLDDALLNGAELQEAVLDDASLKGAQLRGANLQGASLQGATCDGAVLDEAKLEGCQFVKASLRETRFYGAHAENVKLDHANLEKVRFGDGADLTGSTARGVRASGSNWRSAVLQGVDFSGASLDDADFFGADLQNAMLGGCRLRRASFQEAKLTGASLRDADVYEGVFMQASLTETDLRGANLFRANFYRAHGVGARLDGANLDGTTWEPK